MSKGWNWKARIILLLAGVLVITAAFAAPALRRPDDHLLPLAWTAVVGGISLVLLGLGFRTSWQRFLALAALALFGQASALEMMHVPNYEVIQHYLSWRELLTTANGFLLLAPIGQTILMAVGLYRLRNTISAWFKRIISVPATVLLLALISFTAAYPTWSISLYVGEDVLAVWIILVNLWNLIAVTAALPEDFLVRCRTWLQDRFDSNASLAWILAIWATVVSAALCWLVFERVPHIPDDIGYLFQAKYFSLGKLYLPAPSDPAAFDVNNLFTDGIKWWSYGFPAWPAVLAVGVLFGAPWLVNPILAGLTIVLSWVLLARIYGRPLANACVALLAVSPWFLFMSASFMAHPISVVWVLIALLAVQKIKESGHARWGLITGACVGLLLLTRPLEAVAIAAAIGIWTLTLANWKLVFRALAGMAVAGLCIGGLIFPYDYALTGNLLVTPHQQYADAHYSYAGADRLGFGADVGNVGWTNLDPLPGHGPLDVIINAVQNSYNSGFELFGWSFGSFGFAALFLFWRAWKSEDLIFLLIPLMIIGAHSFYWFSGGPDFGARYWYQILIPLVVLTVRGIQELGRRWAMSGGNSAGVYRIKAFVAFASLAALINFIPWRSLGKYYRYRDMSADVARLADKCHFGHALVFIEDKEEYPSAFVFNPPSLDSPGPIYVHYLGAEQLSSLAQHFPDRSTWIVMTGSLTNQALVKGPSVNDSTPGCHAVKTGATLRVGLGDL